MDELRREDEERARVEAEQSEKLIAEMMKNEPELIPRLVVRVPCYQGLGIAVIV